MFNSRESKNILLTFQSTPPFLVENFLSIALVILMAVPLISRIHRFLINWNYIHTHSTVREFNDRFPYREQRLPVRTIRSTPNLNQSEFLIIKSDTEISPKINNDVSDSNKSVDKFDIYDYDYHRYKLLGEKLTKQYGFQQATENIIFNLLHLNSIDSNTGIKLSKKYDHHFFDCIENFFRKTGNNINDSITMIHPRDYFLTTTFNKKSDTFGKVIDTTLSMIDVDQRPKTISSKQDLKNFFEVPERQKGSKLNRDDNLNKVKHHGFSTENKASKKKIGFELHSQPSSPLKEIEKIANELITSEQILKVKESSKKSSFVNGTSSISAKSIKKVSYLHKLCGSMKIQDKTGCDNILSKFGKEKNNEKNCIRDRDVNEDVTSDVFRSSNSYLSSSPSRRSRPSFGGTSLKTFKRLMPKVNSRPRSSGDNFAWEVPDNSGKIWSVENDNKTKLTPATRPRSANPAITRKKSLATMSVLESIIDLTCNVTIDTQDSFTTMDVDKIKQRLENSELPLKLKYSTDGSRDDTSSKFNSKSTNKPKVGNIIPVKLKSKPMSRVSDFVTNRSSIYGQNKSYLQARSGKYSLLQLTHIQKNKNNY